jgi:hypothetical protein
MRFRAPDCHTLWRNRAVEGEGGQNARWPTAKFERFFATLRFESKDVARSVSETPASTFDKSIRDLARQSNLFHA